MVRHSVIPVFLPFIFLLVHASPLKHASRLGAVPTPIPGTIFDFFFKNDTAEVSSFDQDTADYDMLRLLFKFAGEEELLKSNGRADNGITLFAPTDEALKQTARDLREIFLLRNSPIPKDEATAWKVYLAWFDTLEDPKAKMSSILRYHVVIDKEFTQQELVQEQEDPLLNTSSGEVILLSGVSLNNGDSNETFEDPQLVIEGCHYAMDNGIIHPIDRMLFPHPQGQDDKPPQHVPPIPSDQDTAEGGDNGGSLQSAPRPSATSTASGTSDGEQDPACFPAASVVHLRDGSTITMSQLSAGHVVMSSIRERTSSPVYLFSHRQHQVVNDFVRITSSRGHEITLTPGHYLYANYRKTAASSVKPGDVLQTMAGESYVTSVTKVREKGLFAPHTLHGDLVVNGILVSSYTTAVSPRIAHMLLWPLRMLVRAGFAVEPLGGLLYNGSPRLAAIIPGGYDVY